MNEEGQKSDYLFWIGVVIILVIILVVYLVSLGRINVGLNNPLPDEFKDSKATTIRRHKILLTELSKNIALKSSLDRRFSRVYFFVRTLVVLLSFVMILLIGIYFGENTLGGYLDLYQASILSVFILHFLTFGTITNFRSYIEILKKRVENWVWSKHINLPNEISVLTTEVALIETQLSDEGAADHESVEGPRPS